MLKMSLAQFAVRCLVALALTSCLCSLSLGQTFDPPQNLSETTGGVEEHQVVANGNRVYVVWSQEFEGTHDIFFRRSTDGGATWDPVINLSPDTGDSRVPRLAVSGENVFIVWGDESPIYPSIQLRRSLNGGIAFEPTQSLTTRLGYFPVIAASGKEVYVVWTGGGIYLTRSVNNGATFKKPQALSTANSGEVDLAAIGTNVYVAWDEGPLGFRRSTNRGVSFEPTQYPSPGGAFPKLAVNGSNVFVIGEGGAPSDIFFVRSADAGVTFEPSENLSVNTGSSDVPQMALSASNVYVTWLDDNLGSPDIFFRRSTDDGVTFDPVQRLSNAAGMVGLPRVTASGNRVYVSWGDWNLLLSLGDVFLRSSSDGGASFNPALNLSENGGAQSPEVIASACNVYVIWKSLLPSCCELFFRRGAESGICDFPFGDAMANR